jgi:hypothetical protein
MPSQEKFFVSLQLPIPHKITSFFKVHMDDIEVAHEARLQELCRRYIQDPDAVRNFKKGFKRVLDIMDNWWENLCQEAMMLRVPEAV